VVEAVGDEADHGADDVGRRRIGSTSSAGVPNVIASSSRIAVMLVSGSAGCYIGTYVYTDPSVCLRPMCSGDRSDIDSGASGVRLIYCLDLVD